VDAAEVDAEPETEPDSGDPSEVTAGTIEAGDFEFVTLEVGPSEGELVILLHGFPQTSASWHAQLPALAAAGYRAVAFDQRGYSPGARPEGVSSYLVPLLAADVLAVADALGAERFHLVGHDWGSAVAWTVAALFPERLLSLTALSVPHPDAYQATLRDPDSCQSSSSSYIGLLLADNAAATLLAANAAGLRFFLQGLDADVIDAYLSVLGTEPALDAALHWYRANLGTDAPTTGIAVGPVSVPTLYLWGDEDPAVCADGPQLTDEYVTGPYRFEVLQGQGHWLPELAADAVTALMLEHLAAHPR
jgi:pimeloyl-ACP methyl ester carboxylesterase